MPVNVIGTLKPKNNGKFPVAEAADIKVTDDLRLDEALENKADIETVNFAVSNKADKNEIVYTTPQMYGAKADGETDDTEAIQACITANRNVFFPKGTYICGAITVPAGRKLTGEERTIIQCNESYLFSAVSGITLDHLDIRCASNTCVIRNSYAYVTLIDCKIQDAEIVVKVDDSHGFSGYFTFERCTIKNVSKVFETGVNINYAKFESCNFSNCVNVINFTSGGRLEAVLFDSCVFEGNDSEYIINFESSTYFFSGLSFNACYFETFHQLWNTTSGGSVNFNGCWFYGANEYIADTRETLDAILHVTMNSCIINAPASYEGYSVNAPDWYSIIMIGCSSDMRNISDIINGKRVCTLYNSSSGQLRTNLPIYTKSLFLTSDEKKSIEYISARGAIGPKDATGSTYGYFPAVILVNEYAELLQIQNVYYGLVFAITRDTYSMYMYDRGEWHLISAPPADNS